jgi:hypothetical protein
MLLRGRRRTLTPPLLGGRCADGHDDVVVVGQPGRARPKATAADRNDTHDQVRHDVIDKSGRVTLRIAGRLHHIGLGQLHRGTRVVVLVHGLDVRVVDQRTGELLRALSVDPTKDYQPTGQPPGPKARRRPAI